MSSEEWFIDEATTLVKAASTITFALKDCDIIGQLPIDEDDLDRLGKLISPFFRKAAPPTTACRFFADYCMAPMAAFLVFVGAHDYSSGTYWDAVWRRLGVQGDVNCQQILGEAFLRFIENTRLQDFRESRSQGGAHRFVAPILLHGGIPTYCLPDFFEHLLLPVTTSTWFESGAQTIAELALTEQFQVDKPVLRFLQGGGPIAERFVEDCVALVDAWRANPATFRSEHLPSRVVNAFRAWVHQEGSGRLTSRREARYRIPWIAFDPYGCGPCLHFPEQKLVSDPADELLIEVVIDQGTPSTHQLSLGPRFDRSEDLQIPVTLPFREMHIRLVGGHTTLSSWPLTGLPTSFPVLAFRERDGRRIRTDALPAEPTWLIVPSDWSVSAQDALPVLETDVLLPRGWAGYTAQLYDLSAVKEITVGPEGRSATCIPVRQEIPLQGRLLGPSLDYGLVLERPAFIGGDLVLELSGTGDELAGWELAVENRTTGHTARHQLADIATREGPDAPVRVPVGPLLDPRPAEYRVVVRGPQGRRWEADFLWMPGVAIDLPPLERLFRTQAYKFTEIQAHIRLSAPSPIEP